MNKKIYNILKEYIEKNPSSTMWFEIANKILDSVSSEDLYIKPKIDEIAKLKFYRLKKLELLQHQSNCELNSKYKEIHLKNIKKLELNSFYPNILEFLFDNKINTLNSNLYKYYIIFKYFKNNRIDYKKYCVDNPKEINISYVINIMINMFYGILFNPNYDLYYKENLKNFNNYKFILIKNIKNELLDDLIYYDTDIFFYKGEHNLKLKIPHEIKMLMIL